MGIIKDNTIFDKTSFLEGSNSAFIEELYIKYINEPETIPQSWREFFDGLDEDKKIYNINADIAAGSVAKELNSRRLLLMTDVEGVLNKDKKLITEINSSIAEKMLKDGDISGGMIPKINTCLDAVNNGVTGVVIVDGRKPHSILFELFSDKGAGTLIRK